MNEIWIAVATLPTPFRAADGVEYRVVVEGIPRLEGTWAGRIAFVAEEQRRCTVQETSQPNRQALEYWATGLEPIYLEGAFGRATVVAATS